jgi:hypothetical protein
VSLELPGNEHSDYVFKIFLHVCEQNRNAKCPATPFSWVGGGWGHCGTNWTTEVVEIATLYEFDENTRFFITSCDPYMDHILRLFIYTFHHKKDTKDGFQEKCLK